MSFYRDLRVAFHSLMRSKGLATIVILTLALGIGANAAIFTLVRGVLLKPLVNRDENRLVYIRQSAPSMGADNTTFSVPEIRDIESSVHSVSEFGDFSQMGFTMVGLGEPRGVQGPGHPAKRPQHAAAHGGCRRIAAGAARYAATGDLPLTPG